MAFTTANSRALSNPHYELDGTLKSTNTFPHLGGTNMNKAWGTVASSPTGNIWSSGSRGNGFPSTTASKDGLKTGGIKDRATAGSDVEDIEGKTGSSSLVEHSVLDDRSFAFRKQRDQPSSHSLSTARGSGSTFSQTHIANIMDFQAGTGAGAGAGVGATAGQNTYFGRLAPEFSLNTQHRAAVALPPSNSNYKNFVSEPQPTVYTKFDRPTNSLQRMDSTSESWADPVLHRSPTDIRVPFPSQQGPKTSSMSRERSQPPSSHSTDHFSFTGTDFSHTGRRTTPNSSRAPSISSQRNSVYSQYATQLPDNFASEFGQLKVNGEHSRPSTSYRSASSRDGHHSRGSGVTPDASVFGGAGIGGKFASTSTPEINEVDRAPQHPSRDRNPSVRNSTGSNYSSHNMKYTQTPEVVDPHFPVDGGHNGASYREFDASQSQGNWHSAHTGPTPFSRRNTAYPEAQGYVDPRHMQQMLATHFRNDYAALYNSYAMSGNLQLGTNSFLPFFPLPLNTSDAGALPRTVTGGDGVQSALLYEFKSQTKNQRWELKDIHDHIAEFAGDQHGSRFIQTKLETATSDEKDRVFREIEPNAIQLMTDVFGNYVIQKFFENGDQTHKKTLANKMQGQVLNLSLQMYGCRVVQKALDHVLVDQQACLIKELDGNVIKCVRDQNGNHVIQKAIERCPPHTIAFIIAAFQNQVQILSVHPYGCRVMQRCLEFCDPPSKSLILLELVDGIQTMISDQFGNYVVQHIVSKDGGAGRQQVLDIVIKSLEIYSKHKFASNVVEKCIEQADDRWRRQVLYILISETHQRTEGESVLIAMLRDGYGNYVIQKLLDSLCTEDYIIFVEALHPAMAHAKRSQTGKQLLSIEKKMHRYQPAYNHGGLNVTSRPGPGPYPMPLPTPPHASHGSYGSTGHMPPPPLPDNTSFNTSADPSSNHNVIEGTPAVSRDGSEQPV